MRKEHGGEACTYGLVVFGDWHKQVRLEHAGQLPDRNRVLCAVKEAHKESITQFIDSTVKCNESAAIEPLRARRGQWAAAAHATPQAPCSHPPFL